MKDVKESTQARPSFGLLRENTRDPTHDPKRGEIVSGSLERADLRFLQPAL